MDWSLSGKQWLVVLAIAFVAAFAVNGAVSSRAVGNVIGFAVPLYVVACTVQSVTGWGATADGGKADAA